MPRSELVGFVVGKVALGQLFLKVLRFSPVEVVPQLFHIDSRSCGWRTTGPLSDPVPQSQSRPTAAAAVRVTAQYSG